MTINRDMSNFKPPLPKIALALAQITSAQAARWIVIVVLTLTIAFMAVTDRQISHELIALYGIVLGSLFDTPSADRFRVEDRRNAEKAP
jgi:hypothetical protein